MINLNWRDASKELPDDDRNVVVKVKTNNKIYKRYDFFNHAHGMWSIHLKEEGHEVIEWIDLVDITD